MKLSLNKPNDPRGKHLVLTVTPGEDPDVHRIVSTYIIPAGRRANREVIWKDVLVAGKYHRRMDCVNYRFNRDYLELLTLTFPQCDQTPALARYARRMAKDRMIDAEVPKIRVPGLKGKLWNYQKVGAKLACDLVRGRGPWADGANQDVCGGFINDEMGLGKTIQALVAISKYDLRDVLIVTTNSGKWSWASQIERFFPSLEFQVVDGLKPVCRAQVAGDHQITIVNFEKLRTQRHGTRNHYSYTHAIPEFFNRTWSLVIADESHKAKNPTAQQTLGFLALDADAFLCMSGTPFLNRPEELWPALHRVAPDRFPNYEQFVANIILDAGSADRPTAYNPTYVKEVRDFLDTFGIRRRKDQVLTDLPQVVYSTVMCDLTREQRALYRKIKEEMLLMLENGEITTIKSAMAQITRLKQACFSPELYDGAKESAKLTELREIVAQLVANGEKAIIFSQWAKATRIIEREFAEYNPAYVDGSVTGQSRMAEQDRFNTDDSCKLYIGTIRANQEAITLSAATYVIFCDKDWTPLANDQAAARSAAGGLRGIHLSKDDKVNIIYLYAQDTIEKNIDDLLESKAAVFSAFIERDGGPMQNRRFIDSIMDLLRDEAAA